MFGFGRPYNYERFTREMLDPEKMHDSFDDAPYAGDRAPDLEARTLDGDSIALSDYEGGKNVVLVFGSATCPMTAGSIGGLNDLYDEFQGEEVQFVFVYVRESHPGERIRAHRHLDDKVRAAELFRSEEEVEMPIVVDDVKGTIHKRYGKLANPAFLIDKSGRVAFRMMWAQPETLRAAIAELLQVQEERGSEHAIVQGGEDRSMPFSYALLHAHRAIERGGDEARARFTEALGMRGRVALATSAVADKASEKAGTIALTALLTGAVLAGGLVAGAQLRKRRMRTALEPYRYPSVPRPPRAMTGTDYEPVGI